MTGAQFAATYLDPPSGILQVARTPQRDNGAGWPTKAHYLRVNGVADALQRARRNKAMGMTDAQATASTALPKWCNIALTRASLIKDSTGALIAPNILTDFQAMTGVEATPY